MTKNIFMLIREAKAEAAKAIFLSYGDDIGKMANILTADELVKTFDFFNDIADFDDTDGIEEAMFCDYGNACIHNNLLSPETIHRVKSEVECDFFPPSE